MARDDTLNPARTLTHLVLELFSPAPADDFEDDGVAWIKL